MKKLGSMDTIAVIIITAFINIIITGIVSNLMFFRYQKKIESSFAQSLSEHQTKFERQHQKAAETLECLYKEIIVICDKYEQVVYGVAAFYRENLEYLKTMNLRLLGLDMRDIEYLKSKSNDFYNYFDSNRLFLSPSSISTIKFIHLRVQTLIITTPLLVDLLFDFDDSSPEFMSRLKETIKILDFTTYTINDVWDYLWVFSDCAEETKRQAEKLESLYKSIADIK